MQDSMLPLHGASVASTMANSFSPEARLHGHSFADIVQSCIHQHGGQPRMCQSNAPICSDDSVPLFSTPDVLRFAQVYRTFSLDTTFPLNLC